MSPRSGGPGRRRELFFRLLLLGYPADFRRRWEGELLRTFRDAWAEEARGRGARAGAAFWGRVAWDGIVNGMRARRTSSSGRGRRGALAARLRPDTGLGRDVRYGLRGFRRHPAFAVAVVATLAVGLGAGTAIFTVVDAVLLRPLPYAEPEGLVELRRSLPNRIIIDHFSPAVARDLREEADFLEPVALHVRTDMILARGNPRSVRTHAVTPELFDVLGRQPRLGRPILPGDAEPGAEPVAVLSDPLWRSVGGERGILGETIELDGIEHTVVGVMPRDFRFPEHFATEVFIPLTGDLRAGGLEQTRLGVLGRIRPGVPLEQASERAAGLLAGLLDPDSEWVGDAAPFGAHRANPDVKQALWMLSAAVGVLLLIAVVNGVNLLFTRTSAREREIAVRHSLGATRPRLLRQLMTESLLLALLAGGAAVALAVAGVRGLVAIAPSELMVLSANRIVIDGRILLFAFVTTVAVGLAFGLLPALRAAGSARRRAASGMAASGSTTRESHRLRAALVVAEIAVALPLVAAAGLLGGSFAELERVEPGFEADNLVLLQIDPNERTYPDRDAVAALGQALEERIAALPGVAGVTRTSALPPSAGFAVGASIEVEGEAEPRADAPFLLPSGRVRPDYFDVVGTRIVRGRRFDSRDTPGADVAIVDEDMADWLDPGGDALGTRFRLDEGPWLTVVGVLDELMLGGPRGATGDFALLRPGRPSPATAFMGIRTAGDPEALIPSIRSAVREVDPRQPVWTLSTGHDAIAEELAKERFFLVLMGILAGVAIGLAGIGVYGLLSFAVGRRRRELGIRVALGAERAELLRMVLGSGVAMALGGIALGLVAALGTGRLLEGLLFGVEPTSPPTLAAAGLLMLAVAVLACLLPARRATRVEPAEVLKAE